MPRPPSKSGLSPTVERLFVFYLARGLPVERAAAKAGLSSSQAVFRYRATSSFAMDLRAALRDRMAVDISPRAINTLEALMLDDRTPARVRVDAAKALLDRSGFTAGSGANEDTKDSDITLLSRAQLFELAAQSVKQRTASPVDAEVDRLVYGDAPIEGEASGPLIEGESTNEDIVGQLTGPSILDATSSANQTKN